MADPRRVPPRRPAARPGPAPAGPRDVARLRRRSSPGCCSCPGPACAGSACSPSAVIAAIPIVWTYVLHDYQKQRLLSFLDPSPTPRAPATSCTRRRSRSGRAASFGKGLTNGTQDRGNFLPVQATDFVFATLAEELGFLGAIVVFALFVALLWRVLVAGWRSRDPFGLLCRAGIASMILFQLVVNVGHGHRDHADHRASRCRS